MEGQSYPTANYNFLINRLDNPFSIEAYSSKQLPCRNLNYEKQGRICRMKERSDWRQANS